MRIECSAPGKMVLLGEYAVLFGHPAVVMAVNRRARVDLVSDDRGGWSVTAPGFQETPAAFELDGTGFRWMKPLTEAATRLELVDRVVQSLVESELIDTGAAPAALTLDTRDFFRSTVDGSTKLGLGSSAALTVALTGALRARQESSPLDLGQLLALHRAFQGGRGSGIDLAASRLGGVLEYRLNEGGDPPSAMPLELPAGLELVCLWTGSSASTADFLERLERGIRAGDRDVAAALDELGTVSTEAVGNLRSGEIAPLLDEVSHYGDALERLGHAAGIPILSDEHARLRDLADRVGVRYKPSGAGGGDVGIGFSDDPAVAAEFSARASERGFPLLGLEVDPRGLETSRKFTIPNS